MLRSILRNIILLWILSTITLQAQVRKFSNEFLSIGVGARGHGMAGAQVASISDANSAYWNPAGLGFMNSSFQVCAMHAEWYAGIGKYDYLSIAKPLGNGPKRNNVIGFSLVRLGVDNIPNTFNLLNGDGGINYDNVTPFSAADYAGFMSYARLLGQTGLSIGGNIKMIHRKAGKFANAWGFGLDLGIQYRKNNFSFGTMFKDVSSTFNAWQFNFTEEEKLILGITGNEIPENSLEITRPKFILGTAYSIPMGKHFSLLTELNVDVTTDGQRNVLVSSKAFNLDPSLGIEANYRNIIFLRGGIGKLQKVIDITDPSKSLYSFQPNVGVGVHVARIGIDYAFTDIGDFSEGLYSHVFSLIIDLKPKQKTKLPGNDAPPIPSAPKRIIEQID